MTSPTRYASTRPASSKSADTTAALHPLLAERWSPRGFDDAHALDDQTITALLEAARWAPSAGNSQPWRFLVARRGESAHERLVEALAPGNRTWAPAASALVLVGALEVDAAGRELPWALYDTGQAVHALTVQAEDLGLAVHQMGGFDAYAARRTLGLPEAVRPVVVVALGRHDASAALSEQLAERERAPRERAALSTLLLEPPAARSDAA